MRFLLALLVAVSVFAACDTSGDDPEFDLTFRDADGEVVAKLRFPEPSALPCRAIDCNEADWRLVEGDLPNAVTLGQSRGTLRAAPTADGWSLTFIQNIADAGSAAEIAVDGGVVTGTWSYLTFGGPVRGGTVSGTFR